jgi:hypothetical protein
VKEAVVAQFKVLSRNLPEGIEKTAKKLRKEYFLIHVLS